MPMILASEYHRVEQQGNSQNPLNVAQYSTNEAYEIAKMIKTTGAAL